MLAPLPHEPGRRLRCKKGEKRLVNLMKILLIGLFTLALVTTAMFTGPMSAGTVALVTVQRLPTPPDWRAP
jgi:hypothetical protein